MRVRSAVVGWLIGAVLGAPLAAQETPGSPAKDAGSPSVAGTVEPPRRPNGLEHVRTGTGFTLADGEVELDFISSYAGLRGADGLEIRGEFGFGVTRSLQLEVGVALQGLTRDAPGGWHRLVEFESKWTLVSDASFVLAATGALELAHGSALPTWNQWEWGTDVAVSATLGRWRAATTRAHVEVGIATEGLTEVESGLLNLALERPVGGRWSAAFAWNGRASPSGWRASVVPGIEWRATTARGEGGVVGVGVPIGMFGGGERWGIVLHIEHEF